MSKKVFRLMRVGAVDKVMAFENLPDDMVGGIEKLGPEGLPREWGRWLKDEGSVTEKGSPVFYFLDYINVNKDKEKWQEISNYVRRVCDARIRLMDRLEDMAKPMGQGNELSLFPEDVPVIPLPQQINISVPPVDASLGDTEEAPRRRGRPAKVTE